MLVSKSFVWEVFAEWGLGALRMSTRAGELCVCRMFLRCSYVDVSLFLNGRC